MTAAGLVVALACAAHSAVLTRAHSHNDYRQPRPLLAALDQGFMSVEADVHLRGRELLIGHTGGDIKPGVTLQSVYLDPLLARVKANGGTVHKGGPKGFLLLVEFKSDADESYSALREILQNYRALLTAFDSGKIREGAVTIAITGHKPEKLMRAEPLRYAAIDGDLSDVKDPDRTLFITVSEDWNSRFSWRGGSVPTEELKELRRLVGQAKMNGKRLRFWAIPDREEAWALLYDEGVDLINTDKVEGLGSFLRRQGFEDTAWRRLRRWLAH